VPTVLTVTSVNGSGGITAFNISKGKGLRTSKINTTVSFQGGSGTGAQFALALDSLKMITPSLSNPGTGYTLGNVLTYLDPIAIDGTQGNMDEWWDILIHGVAQDATPGQREDGRAFKSWAPLITGSNAGWGVHDNSYLGPDTAAAAASGKPWASGGGAGGFYYTEEYSIYPGGSGGGGWGGGNGGSYYNSIGSGSQSAGDGSSGYSVLNTTYVTAGALSTENYGITLVELTLDGQIELIQSRLLTQAINV
jgi:hypothetical protein